MDTTCYESHLRYPTDVKLLWEYCQWTIHVVYEQQQARFDDPDYQIKNRIVSLHKDYIRPIVRGKETKRTEFGAKVHCFQVDGISFVEHLSFNAFNEGIRLKSTVALHQQYFDRTRQLGADRIYATNANRHFCTTKGIATSFVRKGPKPKQPTARDKMKKALAAARAAVMEGAFGNEKLHYGLQKVRAKTEATETLWICFGIWTASAQKIAKRMARSRPCSLAA